MEMAVISFITQICSFYNIFCVIFLGLFQAHKVKVGKKKDINVDGGVLCNYPVHAFDGM